MAAKSPEAAVDKTQAAMQKATDKAEDQGHYGVKVDPTPNEHYTVDGVVAGKPTPETDRAGARYDQHHYEGATA